MDNANTNTVDNTIAKNPKDTFAVPEVIAEYSPNWTGYAPAGGWAWYALLKTHFLPTLNKLVTEFAGSAARLDARIRISCESAKAVMSVAEILRGVKDTVADAKAHHDGMEAAERAARMEFNAPNADALAWLEAAPAHCTALSEWLNGVDLLRGELDALRTDTAFIVALRDFFEKDNELDALLWGIYTIPVKYRTKVFRHTYRLYKEVMDARSSVRYSKSVLGKLLMKNTFGKPFDMVAAAYDHMPVFFKAMKKGIEARGAAFWDKFDDPSNAMKQMHETFEHFDIPEEGMTVEQMAEVAALAKKHLHMR